MEQLKVNRAGYWARVGLAGNGRAGVGAMVLTALALTAALAGCEASKPAGGPKAMKDGMITGTVTFMQTIDVPQGMPIVITIRDVSDPKKPMVLATKTMMSTGAKTMDFAVQVDPAMIKDGMKLEAEAGVMMKDGAMMMSRPVTIFTGGQGGVSIMFAP